MLAAFRHDPCAISVGAVVGHSRARDRRRLLVGNRAGTIRGDHWPSARLALHRRGPNRWGCRLYVLRPSPTPRVGVPARELESARSRDATDVHRHSPRLPPRSSVGPGRRRIVRAVQSPGLDLAGNRNRGQSSLRTAWSSLQRTAYYVTAALGTVVSTVALVAPLGPWRMLWLGLSMCSVMWGTAVYLLAAAGGLAARATAASAPEQAIN